MKRVISILILMLVLAGCTTGTTKLLQTRPQTDLRLDENAKASEKLATDFYNNATDPEVVKEKSMELKAQAVDLWSKFKKNMETNEYIKKLESLLIKYENSERQQILNILIFMLVGGLLCLIGGAACCIFGSQAGMSGLGIQLIALGTVIVGLAFALLKWPGVAITIGIAVLIAGMLYVIYKWMRVQQRSKRIEGINERVMVEIIRSFEYLKHHKWNDDTKELVNTFQSPETQEKIDEIKQLDTYKTIKIKGSRRDEH